MITGIINTRAYILIYIYLSLFKDLIMAEKLYEKAYFVAGCFCHINLTLADTPLE